MKTTSNNMGAYAGALANLTPMLTPYGRMASRYANGSQAGSQAVQAYQSRVTTSQTNGAGPNIAPVSAPWSFQGFALGIKDIGPNGAATGSKTSILTYVAYGLGILVVAAILWKFLRK
jgi:hypothetical protein